MKKHFLLLALLTSLSLSGCDAFESFINNTPTEEKDGKKDEDTKIDDEDKKEEEQEDTDDEEQEVVLESISVEGNLTKKQYYLDDEWSSDGLWIDGHYSNGDVKLLDSNEYDLGFNPYKAISTDITQVNVSAMLKHDDVPCKDKSFDVEVFNPIPIEKEIISIEIKGDLAKKTYNENDNWDPTGLTIEATFDDYSKSNLTSDDYTLTYNPQKAVKNTKSVIVTATLNGSNIKHEKSFNVTVKNEYTISFNGNDATSGSMDSIKTTESSYQLPTCLYQKEGYTFDKWALNSVSGTKYNPGDYISVNSDCVIYAIWKENPKPVEYTVSFNGNGATSGSMDSVIITESSYIVPECAFLKERYTFKNWALNSKSGVAYNPGETITNISSNITLYAIWDEDTSGDDYYKDIGSNLKGQDLIDALNALNNSHKKKLIGYDGLKSAFKLTERTSDTPANKMVGFYDDALVSADWDNQATWNREHIWPNSHGGGKKGDIQSPYVDADIHMTRPASVKINSERGNSFYGKSLYDPGQYVPEYRGIAARIIFYCAIADTRLLVIDENDGGGHHMGKLSDMLEWNLSYLPTTSSTASTAYKVEQNRNEVIYSHPDLQGNRNPFIDHPEYACRIWGNTNSQTKKVCGMQ